MNKKFYKATYPLSNIYVLNIVRETDGSVWTESGIMYRKKTKTEFCHQDPKEVIAWLRVKLNDEIQFMRRRLSRYEEIYNDIKIIEP